MKIKIKHIVLTVILSIFIFFYLTVQPYILWLIAVHRPFTPGHVNNFYHAAAATSIFKFQKEFTIDWIASDALFVVKDYDSAKKYIDAYNKYDLAYKDSLNLLREFELNMVLKNYDEALKIAQKKEQNSVLLMKVYIELKDYDKAMDAYNKYCKQPRNPRVKNGYKQRYLYRAQIENACGHYKEAHKYINKYFENAFTNYLKAWEVKADIEKNLGLEEDYQKSTQKINEIKKENEEYINKSMRELVF